MGKICPIFLPLGGPVVNTSTLFQLLMFLKAISIKHEYFFCDTLYFLSAGVGRAGCFICIDATLERMKHEDTVDIYGQVTCMRAERNYMVMILTKNFFVCKFTDFFFIETKFYDVVFFLTR